MLLLGCLMPAKKVISKQNIVEAALKIVRKEGMEGLNMRSVSKECSCSTQPIYLSFTGMEELKSAVAGRIVEIYKGYLNDEIVSGKYPPYKATGMGYSLCQRGAAAVQISVYEQKRCVNHKPSIRF